MAHSPDGANGRANVIREMARGNDGSRSRHSAPSSIPSDGESVHDSGTNSHHMPALPAANDTLSRVEAEYQINTSALRRAFPDFSQYGSSDEDSIEVGRGLKRGDKQAHGTLHSEDVSEDISFSLGNGERYRITGTPPVKPRKADYRKTSQKENLDPLIKTTDYVSGGSQGSRNPTVESDDSVSLANTRPTANNRLTRNTRFGSAHSGTLPHSAGHTFESSLLPDLPNLTELISGQREDGTPLFTRSAKSRSRFAVPGQKGVKAGHIAIENVPIPADEKALLVSLKLLQEKVTKLESEKAQSEKKADDYEQEVLELKSKLDEYQIAVQHDSGIGSDAEEAHLKEWKGEKSELEAAIKSLEVRLERANKKLSASMVVNRDLTSDREAAHQQLALAHLNTNELERESKALREEISKIKKHLALVIREHETTIAKLTAQEKEFCRKIERRERAVQEMGAIAKEIWNTRHAAKNSIAPREETTAAHVESFDHGNAAKPQAHPSSVKTKASRFQTRPRPLNDGTITHSRPHALSQNQQQSYGGNQSESRSVNDLELTVADLTVEVDVPTFDARKPAAPELTLDSTYRSFLEGDEISKLKRILQEDQDRLSKPKPNSQPWHGQNRKSSATTVASNSVLPRKSSLRDGAAGYSKHQVHYEEPGYTGQDTVLTGLINNVKIQHPPTQDANPLLSEAAAARKTTGSKQASVHSTINRAAGGDHSTGANRHLGTTSTFILPDITITGDDLSIDNPLGKAAESTKQKLIIQRPIPVSERKCTTLPGEDEPTMRPAQPPSIALAVVIRCLEEEVSQLKTQLQQQEALYHQHDPALSIRRRKSVDKKIKELRMTIEVKSDQIYALYDVLEGQKHAGLLMTEDEIEVTMSNVMNTNLLRGIQKKGSSVKYARQRLNMNDGRVESGDDMDDELSDGDELLSAGNVATQTME